MVKLESTQRLSLSGSLNSIIKRKWLHKLIGLVVLGIIISQLKLQDLVSALSGVNVFLLVTAISMYLLVALVKAWRWRLMLRSQGIRYRLSEAYMVYLSSFYIGLITPGRAGDLLKVLDVRKKGHSLSRSLFSVLIDRFLDISVLLFTGYISLLVIGSQFGYQLVWLVGLALLSLIGVVLVYLYRKRIYWIVEMGIQFFVPRQLRDSITVGLRNLFSQFGYLGLPVWLSTVFLSLLAWFLHVSQVYVISLAIGLHIPPFYFMAMFSLATLVGLLPISVLGLGTRDAVLIFTFNQIGLSSEMAVAFSTLILLSLVASGVLSYLAWLRHPLTWS